MSWTGWRRRAPPFVSVIAIAVILIVAYRAADLSWYDGHQDDLKEATLEHIRITLSTLAISLAIALPVGTIVARLPRLYTPIIGFLGLVYTIPSLAFLAFLVPYVGIGLKNALIALVAYAQFILVRNIAVGLRQVDPAVIDAARGMGMSPTQILFRIEYPLALPVIVAGLRIATVSTIAIATIASLVDAGGLGTLLFDGINNSFLSTSELQIGAIAVSLLALCADLLLRVVERFLPASRARAAAR